MASGCVWCLGFGFGDGGGTVTRLAYLALLVMPVVFLATLAASALSVVS